MKNIISLVLFAYVTVFSSFGATWTMHGVKDNYSDFIFWSSDFSSPQIWARWDWDWDVAVPAYADSGISVNYENPTGYSDTLVLDAPPGYFLYEYDVSAPYPLYDPYHTFGCFFDWTTMTPLDTGITAGEYWLDFDSLGLMRLSTTQPSDFGKWSWDGSVNPSWIEPLSLKINRGKKHRK